MEISLTWLMILVLTRPIALHCDKHIDRIVAKAYSRIGLLFRGVVYHVTGMRSGERIYITYIGQLLEYASNVWSHHLLMHINSILLLL